MLRPRLAQKNVFLLHDNASSHTALFTVEPTKSFKLLSYTPYSPDIGPCDFILYPEQRKKLAGNKYETSAALFSAVNQYLSSRTTSLFAERIQNLSRRWQKCIAIDGD